MFTCNQKMSYNGYTIGSRVDASAYKSILGLVEMAGYPDVSSFVREAVYLKCQDIASNMAENMAAKAQTLRSKGC